MKEYPPRVPDPNQWPSRAVKRAATTSIASRFIEAIDPADREKLKGIWIEKALMIAVEPLSTSHAALLAAAKETVKARAGAQRWRALKTLDAAIAAAEEVAS